MPPAVPEDRRASRTEGSPLEPRTNATHRPNRTWLYVRRFLWKAWAMLGCLFVFMAGRTPIVDEADRVLRVVASLLFVALLPGLAGFVRLLARLVTWSRAPWRPAWRRPWWALGSNWLAVLALLVSAVAGLAHPLTGYGSGIGPALWPAPAELAMLLLTAREVRQELERAARAIGPPQLPTAPRY